MLWVIITAIFTSFFAGILSVFSCRTFEKRAAGLRIFFVSGFTLVAVLLTCKVCYDRSFEEGAITREGISIPAALRPELEGKVITPLGVVCHGEVIFVIANDKLYTLLGTVLEKDLTPTNMVGRKLIFYQKGKVTHIGVVQPEAQAVPTQIGYTNTNEHYQNALPKVK